MSIAPLTVGVITGLAAEARIARRFARHVVCSGGRPETAAAEAKRLVDQGARLLFSFGIAGGLSPDLKPGTLIVADAVVTDQTRHPAKTSWAVPRGARIGTIYGGADIVGSVAEKAELAAHTGAIAADLESGPVARIAAAAGIPFIVLRAIADPAWHTLPAAALLPLDEQGRPRLGAVFGSIMKRPGQIPGLIITAFETRAALKALLRASRVLAV